MTWKGRCLWVPVVLVFVAVAFGAEQPRETAEDPLPVDSQWKGKLTQVSKSTENGIFPPELNTVLTITHRRGQDFEAELHEYTEALDLTFLVRGRIIQGRDKSLTMEFKSHGVKGVPKTGVYYLDVPYTARLTGDDIGGIWTYEDKSAGVDLEGTFTLKRSEE